MMRELECGVEESRVEGQRGGGGDVEGGKGGGIRRQEMSEIWQRRKQREEEDVDRGGDHSRRFRSACNGSARRYDAGSDRRNEQHNLVFGLIDAAQIVISLCMRYEAGFEHVVAAEAFLDEIRAQERNEARGEGVREPAEPDAREERQCGFGHRSAVVQRPFVRERPKRKREKCKCNLQFRISAAAVRLRLRLRNGNSSALLLRRGLAVVPLCVRDPQALPKAVELESRPQARLSRRNHGRSVEQLRPSSLASSQSPKRPLHEFPANSELSANSARAQVLATNHPSPSSTKAST